MPITPNLSKPMRILYAGGGAVLVVLSLVFLTTPWMKGVGVLAGVAGILEGIFGW